MMRLTSRPAILPASLVAWRWLSLKYAGTVITASVTSSPRCSSAISLRLRSTCAEISGGVNSPAFGLDAGHAAGALGHLVGHLADLGGHLGVHAAHEPLDRVDGVRRVGHGLALGQQADQALAVLVPRDHRRGGAIAFLVLDDLGLLALHDGDHAVGGAEIDSDDLAHGRTPFLGGMDVPFAGSFQDACRIRQFTQDAYSHLGELRNRAPRLADDTTRDCHYGRRWP